MHQAAYNGHLKVIEYLWEFTDVVNPTKDNGWTVLHYAAHFGHLNVVKAIAAKLSKQEIEVKNEDGETPLDKAKEKNHQEIVDYLSNI